MTKEKPVPSPVPARAAPAGAQNPFQNYPLFLRETDTAVAWSPKSGCSHVVLWAFLHEGLFEQANRYSAWPHDFRVRVYHQGPLFGRPLRRLQSRGGAKTLLKVTRDPKRRLISIFRHVCRFPILRAEVQAALGFDVRRRGLSLADLDTVLGTLQLAPPTAANPHVRTQRHPLWDMSFARVITLNLDEVPLNASLNAVEKSLGLPHTDFDAIPEFGRLREAHYAKEGDFAGPGPIESHRFHPKDTEIFPKRALLASPLLERMARRHYVVDYGLVDSGDTAGELFQDVGRVAT
jgi:hypothetical protein